SSAKKYIFSSGGVYDDLSQVVDLDASIIPPIRSESRRVEAGKPPASACVRFSAWAHGLRLGHPFNPARRVNRVDNHRDLALPRMAEDHRAEVNSDADAQGHVELALERWAASP